MGTPRGAEHRDLEQRIRNLQTQLDALSSAVLRQRQLSVTQGDFVVSGGGSVIVQDGGHVEVVDENGVTIMDVGGPAGFRRPYMPWHVLKYDPVYTSSASYVITGQGTGYSQHPAVEIHLNTYSAAGTTGQCRVGFTPDVFDLGSTVWGSPITIGSGDGGTGHTVRVPAIVGYGTVAGLYVQSRRTAGAGTVGTSTSWIYGTE